MEGLLIGRDDVSRIGVATGSRIASLRSTGVTRAGVPNTRDPSHPHVIVVLAFWCSFMGHLAPACGLPPASLAELAEWCGHTDMNQPLSGPLTTNVRASTEHRSRLHIAPALSSGASSTVNRPPAWLRGRRPAVAQVPMAEMLTYDQTLTTTTGGRGG